MLARNVVARLAADAPKSSTHDLSRAANLIQRKLLFSNGFVASLSSSRSRAYRATLLQSRRSYATEARATKPTPKVKQDVKKAAAQKTAGKTTTTKAEKKPAAKKAVKKAVKPIKKKKPVAKAKPKRVAKTPEEKEKIKVAKDKAKLREYRAKALNPPVFPKAALTAWTVFQTEHNAELFKKGQRAKITKEAQGEVSAKYKNLTPAEREHYNHIANERTAAKNAEFEAWLKSHSPEEIRVANIARAYLRRRCKEDKVGKSQRWKKLEDDRSPLVPAGAYFRFTHERRESGDFKNIPVTEGAKLIGQEWKALSASEKKKYEDEAAAERNEYNREFENVFGHKPESAPSSPSAV